MLATQFQRLEHVCSAIKHAGTSIGMMFHVSGVMFSESDNTTRLVRIKSAVCVYRKSNMAAIRIFLCTSREWPPSLMCEIPRQLYLCFLRSSNVTALVRILSYVWVSGISKMATCNRKWKYTTNLDVEEYSDQSSHVA